MDSNEVEANYVRDLETFEDKEATTKDLKKYAKKNKIKSIVLQQHNNTKSYIEVYFTTVMFSHEFDTYNVAKEFLEGSKVFKGIQATVRIFGQKSETIINCGTSLE